MFATIFAWLSGHLWVVAFVCGLYCLAFVIVTFVRANRKIDEIIKEEDK